MIKKVYADFYINSKLDSKAFGEVVKVEQNGLDIVCNIAMSNGITICGIPERAIITFYTPSTKEELLEFKKQQEKTTIVYSGARGRGKSITSLERFFKNQKSICGNCEKWNLVFIEHELSERRQASE